MDDRTIVAKCAEAMGYKLSDCQAPANVTTASVWLHRDTRRETGISDYNPLTDDAQAMALVKRFELDISAPDPENGHLTWAASSAEGGIMSAPDLNRAICLAVAQRGKE